MKKAILDALEARYNSQIAEADEKLKALEDYRLERTAM